MISMRIPKMASLIMLENQRLHHIERAAHRKTQSIVIARYYAAKRQRSPAWRDVKAIRAIYRDARELSALTGIQFHVDHAIPLKGEVVSGLHVHTNLQIMTGMDHRAKHSAL